MPCLALADVAGIQRHITAKPKLKDIAVASREIEGLGSQPNGVFAEVARRHGAEVIVAAGGNAAFVTETARQAKTLLGDISLALIRQERGLEISGATVEFASGSLARNYRTALAQLSRNKMTEPRSAVEQFAGLVVDAEPPAPTTIEPTIAGLIQPNVFDDLILGSDEKSQFMAAVCIDGLCMGRKLNDWLEAAQASSDEQFAAGFRAWSDSLKQHWRNAWTDMVAEWASILTAGPEGGGLAHYYLPQRRLRVRDRFLPLRKIYQGGDDLSFVCDSRIALAFTCDLVRRLANTRSAGLPQPFDKMAVSAGLVFVDSHFPFFRALAQAEGVRQCAKRRAVDTDAVNPPSTIDWWVNRQGALYRPDPPFPGATMKPYRLHSDDEPSWTWIDKVVLPGFWNMFGGSRGKFKDLVAAGEQGGAGAQVKRLMQLRPVNGHTAFGFLGPQLNEETGFSLSGERTPLLDVGELYDLHFPHVIPEKEPIQ